MCTENNDVNLQKCASWTVLASGLHRHSRMHRIKPDRDYDVVVAVVEAPLIFVQQLPVHETTVVERSVRDRTAWQIPPIVAVEQRLFLQLLDWRRTTHAEKVAPVPATQEPELPGTAELEPISIYKISRESSVREISQRVNA